MQVFLLKAFIKYEIKKENQIDIVFSLCDTDKIFSYASS